MDRNIFGDPRNPSTELNEIFGSESSAATWARSVLDDAGLEPKKQVSAIAAIRAAEPRLGLKSATYLAGLLKN